MKNNTLNNFCINKFCLAFIEKNKGIDNVRDMQPLSDSEIYAALGNISDEVLNVVHKCVEVHLDPELNFFEMINKLGALHRSLTSSEPIMTNDISTKIKIIPEYMSEAYNQAIAQYKCEGGEVISFQQNNNDIYVTFFQENINGELLYSGSTSFEVTRVSIESFIKKIRPKAIKIK